MTKKTIPHPSEFIDQEHALELRRWAAAAEHAGMLQPEQLDIIYSQGWFKLLAPWVYGGLERSLPALVRLEEGIAWADGSTGWVVTLCSGAGWFGGFIAPELAHRVYNTPNVCLAGSGAATGTAEMVGTGYRINGHWKYASGALHATHFTANCVITKNGETVLDDKGKPWVLSFLIDRKDIEVVHEWKHIGMVATGSHSFKADGVEVGGNQCFHIDPAYAEVNDPLYKYPFLQLAEATLAVNLSGMAVHFCDLAKDIFEERKKHPRVTDADRNELDAVLHRHCSALQSAREALYQAIDASWQNAGKDDAELLQVSHQSRVLAKAARATVSTLYSYCGLDAALHDTELNRVWRDIHTAGQHMLLTFGGL